MARYLFTVDYVGHIFGRGMVLIPGISRKEYEDLQVGDAITLEKPDGTRSVVKIDGFEFPIPNPNNTVWVSLNFTEDKSAVPIGTKVWS